MKQERVILSFIMVLIGLLVAGGAFFFYQSTKTISPNSSASNTISPTPTDSPKIFLIVNQPANESVSTNRTVPISGKTLPEATVIIITDSDQLVLNPSSQGDFSTTVTVEEGQNVITIRAVTPNGETQTQERTVSYSTSSF
jgi:hypothetical protein